MKRQRGRGRKPGGGGGGGNHGNRPLESNGPDVKIRGTAAQIYEKYMQYARDSHSSGDRVKYENFLQHAEHYYRIMAATMPREQRLASEANGQFGGADERDGDDAPVETVRAIEDNGAGDDASEDEGEAAAESRAEDAEDAEETGEAASGSNEAGDDPRARNRRRGRRRRHEGDRPTGERGERAERPERTNGADAEARSALDALAHKQAAVAGN